MVSLPSPPRMNDPLTTPKWCPRRSSPSPRSAVTMRGPEAKQVTSVALTWRHPEPAVSGRVLLLRTPTWLFWVPLVTTRCTALPGSSTTFIPGLVPPALYVTVVAANAPGAAPRPTAVARNDAIAHERCFRDGLIDFL